MSAHWDGTVETEVAIKEATKATIRCIPVDAVDEEGVCVYLRQAVASSGAVRPQLLTGQAGAIDRIECKATAGTIRRRFSNFTYDPL